MKMTLRRRTSLWLATLAVAAAGPLATVPAAQAAGPGSAVSAVSPAAAAATTAKQTPAQKKKAQKRAAAKKAAARKAAAKKAAARKAAARKEAARKAALRKKRAAINSPENPYTPRTGPIMNEPRSTTRNHAILDDLISTIRSVPEGGVLRMSDWNIDSDPFVNNALAAHNRGVTVQILMSGGVADRQNPTKGSFARLRDGFKAGNAGRADADKSYIYGCDSSCRGFGGINHAKFLTASQTGNTATATNVVTISSANLTAAAGNNQWNDSFTVVNNPGLYEYYQRTFDKMRLDRNDPMPSGYQPYTVTGLGFDVNAWFNPARNRPDPFIQLLDKTRCTGATNVRAGRTQVRLAHTAISGPRGQAVVRKLKALRKAGCNVKVVYTLMDRKLRDQMVSSAGGGSIPTRQLVRDRDRDGFFDLYLHTKALTITGNWGGRTNARLVRTGSENLTDKSINSDENGFDVVGGGFEATYARYIDTLFGLGSTRYVPKPPADARMAYDPWQYVEID